MTQKPARGRGFARAASILQPQIRKAAEGRGFAVTRVLTHWDEIAGAEIARLARPVKVSHSGPGFGATLTLLTTGANAPLVEMQKERLRDRINAAYGYNAVARLKITQTSATGFAEAQAAFAPPEAAPEPRPDPARCARAAELAAPVQDDHLRAALEDLGRAVLSRASGPSTR
ncbi:DUF721 domain-containing protein [Rhodosalinus halophilus]|uniref:DUF721 domain-containing protein n=1 Tax=Rhodosalinus halophilus TaxID=2259333 RepID=UPI001F278529|nr:DciA family protein [Rhodosalinus halophilus]